MQEEGNALAERERFSSAIQRWDRALALRPDSAALYELKAQVRSCKLLWAQQGSHSHCLTNNCILQAFMALEQHWPAVQSGIKAVNLDPDWPDGHLTLARAQLSYGEVNYPS